MPTDPIQALHEELPRQAAWVRRLARKLMRDESAAEDLAQEAMLASLRARHPLRGALQPWLARVTANLARRGWRDEESRRRREHAAAITHSNLKEAVPAPDEVLGRLEIQGLLVEELKQLPDPLRRVLVRRYFDGWSAARIGRESGVPAATVRWQLQRALAELRARLDRRQAREGIRWRPALVVLARWRFSWEGAGPAQGPTLGGILPGVLAMKISTNAVVLGALVLATGLGVYLANGGGGAKDPLARASAPLAEPAPPELLPPSPRLAGLERTESRTAQAGAPATPTAEPELAPEPSTLVDGRCVDRDLVLIAGARIFVGAEAGAPGASSRRDGSFSIAYPAGGETNGAFRVEAEGYGTRFVTALIEPALIARGEPLHLGDIVLAPGGSVRGRVLQASGAGQAEAVVRVTEPSLWDSLEEAQRRGPTNQLTLRTTTARDGSFLVTGVTAGMVRVWASAPGTLYAVSAPVEVPVHGEAQVPELLLVPAQRPDRLSGVVLDPEGEPVPRARLRYKCRRRTGGSIFSGADADEGGRFELPASVGVSFDLSASDPAERWVPVSVTGIEADGNEVELRFVATPWIEIVVRSGGEPLTDYAVASVIDASTTEASTTEASTDAGPRAEHPGGRARLHAPALLFSVVVDAPGFALARRGPIEPGAAPEVLEFELEPGPGLFGRVLAYGQPVSGARVTLHDADPRNHIDHDGYPSFVLPQALDEARSDAQGRFVLRARAAGEFAVRAEAVGLAAADAGPFAFDPLQGRMELELAATRGGAVEGRVLVPAGREVSGVIVAVNRGDAHARTVRSGAGGEFRFEGLTPGRWHVARGKLEVDADSPGGTAVDSSGRAEIDFNCVVADGETTRHDVDLRDWEPCLLRGELLANGTPASDWGLEVWPAGRTAIVGDLPSTTTDHEGRFQVEIQEAGRKRLAFSLPRETAPGGSFSIELDVHPGDNPWQADLALGRLEGTIAAANDGLFLYESAEDQELACFLRIAPDAVGHFVLPLVPAGRGAIRCMQGTGSERRTFTLAEVDVPARGTREVHVP
jgi:RNA polymerase sigma-70 factor (ECF subfamily)